MTSRNRQPFTPIAAWMFALLLCAAPGSGEAALVHHWSFDVDGTDSVGGANMTLVNTAAIDNSIFAIGGGSLAVPGAGYASTSANIHVGNQFTIVVWSQMVSGTNFQTFAATAVGGTGSPGFKFFSGRLVSRSLGWEAGGNDETDPDLFSLFAFHQLAAVVDKAGGTVDYYIDGSLVRSGATTDFADDMPLYTGAFADGFFTSHEGWIDDLRIYDTMLTGAEINGLLPTPTPTVTATVTPTATPLVAGCPAAPDTCFDAGKSVFLLKSDGNPSHRRLVWKWLRGVDGLAQAAFGNPVSGGTDFKLCVYDQTGGVSSLAMGAAIPAAGTCDTHPCWSAISDKGWKYRSRTGVADGITKVLLKGGPAGRPRVIVTGKGSGLEVPSAFNGSDFFDQDTSVVVQIHGSGPACWGSTFNLSATRVNDTTLFRAVTP